MARAQLREDPSGRLQWKAGGLARVSAALAKDLTGTEAARAVEDLLRLMAVLRKRGCGPAADALGALVRGQPSARAIAARRLGSGGGIDPARGFMRREGRQPVLRAPSHADVAPTGAVPLKRMLDPHGRDRARAASERPRKESVRGHR